MFGLVLAACGCSGGSTIAGTSVAATSSTRVYNGTASVGDFVRITVNAFAKTITYTDATNNESGTATYTINTDGTYAISDPNGVLLTGYEIPGYAMIISAAKTGSGMNATSLITAVESGPITLATFEGKTFNYMDFRTTAGGIEIGSNAISAGGVATTSTYWPYGAYNAGANSPFMQQTMPISQAVESASGTYFSLANPGGGGTTTVFGTASGQFIVDTPYGSQIGLEQSASSAFSPSYAGTYSAIAYTKIGATTGMSNVETGTGVVAPATITVSATGTLTYTNGSTTITGTLTPVADASYLVGANELTNPCPGLFTFRTTTATSQQDTFVAFQGRAILFGSFTGYTGSSTYDYEYGTGIH